ncbi:hypothetical protein [Streptomyces sp. NPDC005953]|uniref:hypothetical protein n=1 Tax=unclassified Streptomyces TaxID=2593676 RepID=UPI0033EF77B5
MSFDRRASVFQLSAPPQGHYRPVLLPVWVYQAMAPTGFSRTLDTFQMVVLRLCAAGVRDIGELSGLIGLDSALCRTVVARLMERGLMGSGLKLTEAGRDTVRLGEVAETEPRLIRVFQDPGTGALLPRMLMADPVRADVRGYRGRQVIIQFGTAGASRELNTLALDGDADPMRPSERDVLEACRGHDMAARGIRGSARNTRPTAGASQRIRFHGSRTPAYLVCYLIADDDGSGRMWTVLDPFAVGDGRVFADVLAARVEREPDLARLIETLAGPDRRDRVLAARRADRELAQDARADVVATLGEQVREHPEVLAHLADIELARVKDTPRERENLVRNAIRVFECILPGLNEKYPVSLPPSNVSEVRQREFVLTAQRLGALSVPPKMRHHSGSGPRGGLAGDVIKAVWAARGNPDHPFALFIRHRPTLLEDLERSRILRNNATHASVGPPASDELENIRTLAYEAAAHLLGIECRLTGHEKAN